MGRRFHDFFNLIKERLSLAKKIEHSKTYLHVIKYSLPILLVMIVLLFVLNDKNEDNHSYATDTVTTSATYTLTIDVNGGTYGLATSVTGSQIKTVHKHNYADTQSKYNKNKSGYCGYYYDKAYDVRTETKSNGDGSWTKDGYCTKCGEHLYHQGQYADGSWGNWGTAVETHTHKETKKVCTKAESTTYSYTSTTLAVPTKQHYSFTGWTITGPGSISGSTFTFGAGNATITANYIPEIYTILFYANGGSGTTTEQTKTYGVDLILSNSTFTPPVGKHFIGWNTQADGNGTAYTAGQTFTHEDNIALYAQWEYDTYTISFNGNGASGSTASQTKTYGTNITLNSNGFNTPTGYSFDGWNTSQEGNGTSYANNATYQGNSDAVLYAMWKANNYTVSFNTDGGSACSDISIAYGSTYNNLPTTSKTGYTFKGWYKENSFVNKVENTTVMDTASNHTLYAKFEINVYPVTFNYNGATTKNGPEDMQVIYNNPITLPIPSKSQSLFEGWYNGDEKVTSPLVITSSLTLDARWTSISIDNYVYTYEARDITPVVTVTSSKGEAQNTSYYQVTYDNNHNAGTGHVTIEGDGVNLLNSITYNITINPKEIDVNDIEIYDGTSKIDSSNPLVRERSNNDKSILVPLKLIYTYNGEEVLFNHTGEYSSCDPNYDSLFKTFKKLDLVFKNISIDTTNGVLSSNYTLTNSSVTKEDFGKIVDTTKPQFTKIETVAKTYGKNKEIVFTVTSDEDIMVDNTSTIKLLFKSQTGANDNNIVTPIELTYDKSIGTNNEYSSEKKFIYKVVKGDMALNGIKVTGIEFNSKGFIDHYGNELDLINVGSIQDDSLNNTFIDTTDINVTITNNAVFTSSNITSDEEITYTFTFDKDIDSLSFTKDDVLINGLSNFAGKNNITKIDDKTYTMVISNRGLFTPTGSPDNLPFIVTINEESVNNSIGNENLKGENKIILDRALHELECNEPSDSILKGSTVLMFPNKGTSIKYYENDPAKLNQLTYTGTMLTLVLKDEAKNGVLNLTDMYQEKPEWVNSPKVSFVYTVRNGDHIFDDIKKDINDNNPYNKDNNPDDYKRFVKDKLKEYLKDEEDMQVLLGDDQLGSIIHNDDNLIDVLVDILIDKIDDIDNKDDLIDTIKDIIDMYDELTKGKYSFLGDNGPYDPDFDTTNYEDLMIEYELLSNVQKNMFNTLKTPSTLSYYEMLRTRYLSYITGNIIKKDMDTGKTLDDTDNSDEAIEIFGVVHNVESNGDKVEVMIAKNNIKDKVNELETIIKNKVPSLDSSEKVLIPYNINLVTTSDKSPVTIKNSKSLLVKIELPKDYSKDILNIYHIDDFGDVSKADLTVSEYNDHTVLYFNMNDFGDYIITSSLKSLVVSKIGEGTINPNGFIVIPDGENKKELSITIPKYYKAKLYYNDALAAEYKSGSYKYEVKDITSNGYVILYVEDDPDQRKSDNKDKKTVTTTSTFTVQVGFSNAAHMPYMFGYKDGTFKPNKELTRAEVCAMLVRVSKNYDETKNYKEYIKEYSDVSNSSWASNYIGYLTKCGIINGYKDKFRPNDNITRAEFAMILSRMFTMDDKGIEVTFTDIDKDNVFYNSIVKVVKAGIMEGYNKKSFKPDKLITRAEGARVMNKVLKRTPKDTLSDFYKDKITSHYKDVKKNSWYFNDILEAVLTHEVSDIH